MNHRAEIAEMLEDAERRKEAFRPLDDAELVIVEPAFTRTDSTYDLLDKFKIELAFNGIGSLQDKRVIAAALVLEAGLTPQRAVSFAAEVNPSAPLRDRRGILDEARKHLYADTLSRVMARVRYVPPPARRDDDEGGGAPPAPPPTPLDPAQASVGRFIDAPSVPTVPWLLSVPGPEHHGVLPLGMPAALAAAPGVGKSFWLMQAGLAVATGVDILPGFHVSAPGKVVLVYAEEPEVVVHARFASLVEELIAERPDAAEVMARLRANLYVLARDGLDNRLVRPGARRGEVEQTPFAHELHALVSRPDMADLKLIAVDPWSQLAPTAETDPAESTAAVGVLTSLAKATGAAVIVAVHVRKKAGGVARKPSTLDLVDADEIRGSSALVGAVRTVMSMATVQTHESDHLAHTPSRPQDTILLRVSKANHGGGREPFLMTRHTGGVLRFWRDMLDDDAVSDDLADLYSISEVRRVLRLENDRPKPAQWTIREFCRIHAKSIFWRGNTITQAKLERLLDQAVYKGFIVKTEGRFAKIALPEPDQDRFDDIFAPGRDHG